MAGHFQADLVIQDSTQDTFLEQSELILRNSKRHEGNFIWIKQEKPGQLVNKR